MDVRLTDEQELWNDTIARLARELGMNVPDDALADHDLDARWQQVLDLGGRGIRCNTVYCGPMRGPNLVDAMEKWAERRGVTYDEIVSAVSAVMAQGSIPADADVAPAVLLLLSDGARVITGTSFHATNGAWVEHRV